MNHERCLGVRAETKLAAAYAELLFLNVEETSTLGRSMLCEASAPQRVGRNQEMNA